MLIDQQGIHFARVIVKFAFVSSAIRRRPYIGVFLFVFNTLRDRMGERSEYPISTIENFLKVVAANPGVTVFESLFHENPVACNDVDEVREASCETHQLEGLSDWTLLTKVETSCDRILIAGGANVEA